MGIAHLGVQRGPYLVELVGTFRHQRLFPEAGDHSAQCLVLVLLDALVQGYQRFNGRQILGDDHSSGRTRHQKGQYQTDCAQFLFPVFHSFFIF